MENRWPDYACAPANGADFERYVGTALADLGYDVRLLPPANAYGVDLIMAEPGTDKRIVVQTRFFDRGPLSSDAVQQAASGMLAWGAAEGWVVTNAPGFSATAQQLAQAQGVRLLGQGELTDLVTRAMARRPARSSVPLASHPSAPLPSHPSAPLPSTVPAYAPQATAAFDPLAPSQPQPAYDSAPQYAYPSGYQTQAPYQASYPSAYQADYSYATQPYAQDAMPQYVQPKKKLRLAWLWSILITLVLVVAILLAYIFLAPPLFDAIEADNPGLHILRWDEVIESLFPS